MQTTNNVGNPIFVLGHEIILEFSDFLAKTIESFLSKKWGENWFENCITKEENYSRDSKTDLNFLIRQTVDLNNQNFRVAIALSLFGKAHIEKPHLDALNLIRKSRNFWAHPSREVTQKDLNKLTLNIIAIVPTSHALAKKCSQSLVIDQKQGHLSKFAELTSIYNLYLNTAEYKSEVANTLSEFTNFIKENRNSNNYNKMFTSQNHLLNNLYANFQIIQAMYFSLLLDNIIEMRNPRNGAKFLAEEDIDDLYRNLNTDKSLEVARKFAESLRQELGSDICGCDFCKLFPTVFPVNYFKEHSQQKVEEVYYELKTKGKPPSFIGDNDYTGRISGLNLLIMATCLAKIDSHNKEELNMATGKNIFDNWSFDVLNPHLDLDSDAYDDHEVLKAATRLVAIRNGVSAAEVEKWDLE